MVKFETKFDASAANTLNKTVMLKLWWLYLLFTLIFVFLGLITYNQNSIVSIFFIVFGVGFTPLCVITTIISQKKNNDSMSLMSSETIEVYTFDEEFINIYTNKDDEYESTVKMKYSSLYMVKETKEAYLLFISNIQSHVVPKKDLVDGTLVELNNYFRIKLQNKFKEMK